MNRITKIREEIGGKQVDLTFYGRFCSLIEGDRKIILRAIKNGRKKGVIGAIQPGRHDRIWTGRVQYIWEIQSRFSFYRKVCRVCRMDKRIGMCDKNR